MTKIKCEFCGKMYNPDEHTWSAGFGCDHYCSRDCCVGHQDELCGSEIYNCPCY